MELEQLLQGLLGITQTTFVTVPLPVAQLKQGTPIGQGKCKAVRLHFNTYALNTRGTTITATHIYYGDQKAQETELLRGATSHIIITDRLEKIFIRNYELGDIVQVQIEIMN